MNLQNKTSPIIKVRGNTYFLPGKTNAGIYIQGSDAYLIDAPMDSFRLIEDFLDSHDYKLKAILLTHGHADHTKDAHFFVAKYRCPVYCTYSEAAYVHHPFLLCKRVFGSEVPTTLEHPLLCIEAVNTLPYPEELVPFTIQSLSGHHIDMVGIGTPDNVFFVADSIYGYEMIKKPLLFHSEIANVITTLEMLRSKDVTLLVPSHGDPVMKTDIPALVDANLRYIEATKAYIIRALADGPKRREDVVEFMIKEHERKPSYMGFMIMVLTCGNFLNWMSQEDLVSLPTPETDYKFTLNA